jgi:hypothetical protein
LWKQLWSTKNALLKSAFSLPSDRMSGSVSRKLAMSFLVLGVQCPLSHALLSLNY